MQKGIRWKCGNLCEILLVERDYFAIRMCVECDVFSVFWIGLFLVLKYRAGFVFHRRIYNMLK